MTRYGLDTRDDDGGFDNDRAREISSKDGGGACRSEKRGIKVR